MRRPPRRTAPRQRPLALAALAVLIAALPLAGCDSLTSSPYEEQVVVSAALEVGAPFPNIFLTRTVPLDQRVDPNAIAIEDATLSVALLSPEGSVESVFEYEYSLRGEGRYRAIDEETVVLPGRTYRIRVDVPGFDERIVGETTTPEAIDVVERPPDEVVYLGDPFGPRFRVATASTDARQSVYVIGVQAEAPDEYEVFEREDGSFGLRRLFVPGLFGPTPDIASFIDDVDCEPEGADFDCDFLPSDFASGSSPLLNEETYIDNGDGTVTVSVPWLAVSFYGPHTFTLNALDDALVDFVATQAVQFNPTTLSPGEIPNVTSNLRGPAVGVFGSFAAAPVTSTIVER